MEKVTIKVEGMKCDGCANTLRKDLEDVKGVSAAETSHSNKSATVTFDKNLIDVEAFHAAIHDAGFSVI